MPNRYLCKWSSGTGKYLEWEQFETVDFDFFMIPSNSYSESDRFMVGKLDIGDTLDLSDGIGQYHEVERLA